MQVSTTARIVTNAEGRAMLEVAGRPFCELNSMAVAIWTELEGGSSAPQIISRLKRRVDTPGERVAKDVRSFMQILKENLLVNGSVPSPEYHTELLCIHSDGDEYTW